MNKAKFLGILLFSAPLWTGSANVCWSQSDCGMPAMASACASKHDFPLERSRSSENPSQNSCPCCPSPICKFKQPLSATFEPIIGHMVLQNAFRHPVPNLQVVSLGEPSLQHTLFLIHERGQPHTSYTAAPRNHSPPQLA